MYLNFVLLVFSSSRDKFSGKKRNILVSLYITYLINRETRLFLLINHSIRQVSGSPSNKTRSVA